VGLAGHDDFEKIGQPREIGHELLIRIGRQRLREGQVLENGENKFVGGGEKSFHPGGTELQQRVLFVKVPGQAGANGDGALEMFVDRRDRVLHPGKFLLRQMRIENEEDTAIVFAGEFTNHQGTGTRGSFPVNVARAVRGDVTAQRVEILAAPLAMLSRAPCRPSRNFQVFRTGFHGRINERFRFQIQLARFAQKAEGENE